MLQFLEPPRLLRLVLLQELLAFPLLLMPLLESLRLLPLVLLP